jgi:hypothetical protein
MRTRAPASDLRSTAGVALPVVLLGLLAISIVVSGVVVSTSMESAISSVHRGSVESLYRVEEGIETYVATTGSAPGPLQTGTFDVALPQGRVQVTVERLAARVGAQTTDTTYSVIARAAGAGGSRRVAAMFTRQFDLRPSLSLSAGIPSGLVLGADTEIKGNADVKRKPSGLLGACGRDTANTKVTMAVDARVELKGSAKHQIADDTTRATWTRHEMVREVLGIESLSMLIPRADITFGHRSRHRQRLHQGGGRRPLRRGARGHAPLVHAADRRRHRRG